MDNLNNNKNNEKLYSHKGGYISYNPDNLTEKYSSSNSNLINKK